MKNLSKKVFLLLVFIIGLTLNTYADRCETTQNVEVKASKYSGNCEELTYTFTNFNKDQVTVNATYTFTSSNGETAQTSRIYVIQPSPNNERTEKFKYLEFFKYYFDAGKCGVQINVTICQ